MATANPLWGAPRIHGELQTLGIEVSERTVSRLLKPHTRPRSQTWKTFLTNHLASAAMDFFTVPTLTGRVLFVLVVLSHCRRRIVHFNVRASDSDVGGSTGRRGISGRDGAAMVASRSRQRLQRELPAASRGLGHRRGRLSRGEPLAESVRGTADRHNSPRVLGSHDRAQRAPSATRSHDLQPVLSSRPDASWAGERRPRQPADLTTIRVDRSSRFRKSADCITATNGGPRKRARLATCVAQRHRRSTYRAARFVNRVELPSKERDLTVRSRAPSPGPGLPRCEARTAVLANDNPTDFC